jgi:hypothetical protein
LRYLALSQTVVLEPTQTPNGSCGDMGNLNYADGPRCIMKRALILETLGDPELGKQSNVESVSTFRSLDCDSCYIRQKTRVIKPWSVNGRPSSFGENKLCAAFVF